MVRHAAAWAAILLLFLAGGACAAVPPWLAEAARIVVAEQRASARVVRAMSEEQVMGALLRDATYRRQVADALRNKHPRVAGALAADVVADLGGAASVAELSRVVERQAVEAARGAWTRMAGGPAAGGLSRMGPVVGPNTPLPWMPPVYRVESAVEPAQGCRLMLGAVPLGPAVLFATADRLARLSAADSPLRCVEAGADPPQGAMSAMERGLPAQIDAVAVQQGLVGLQLADPRRFKAAYEQASRTRLQHCGTVAQLCASNRGVSFSIGCGEGLELQVSSEAEVSLSMKARSREATITFVE